MKTISLWRFLLVIISFHSSGIFAADCVPAPSSLVSWWSGQTDGADIIGNNPGTLRNGVQLGTGTVGNAFVFNGTNQYIEIPSRTNLLPAGSFTIEAWINPNRTGFHQTILGKWSDNEGLSYLLEVTPGNGVTFAISDLSRQGDSAFHTFATTNNAIPLNTWTHVAGVYDQAAGKRIIYVNGVRIAERNDPSLTVFAGNAAVGIGGRLTGAFPSYLFKGSIDEVSFYNRALSASEVTSIFNASTAGKCGGLPASCVPPPSGLASWWSGENDASDSIGNNTGILRNGVLFTAGKVGNAFRFNGSNQFVEIPSRTNLLPTGSFSIEAWIHPTASSDGAIFSKWSNNERSYIFSVTTGNGLLFGISDTARQLDGAFHVFSTTNNLVPLNVWTHVAAVYDQPTGKRIIYVNGIKVAERTDPSITIYSAQNSAVIGARLATATEPSNLFAGSIDEVSYYNRALAGSEVLSLFNSSNSGKCTVAVPATPCVTPPSGLASWWSGENDASDSIGNNTGILRNGVQFSAGKVGNAFRFNGSQFVEIPSRTNLLPTGSFSIEAWVQPTGSSDGAILSKWSNNERSYIFSVTPGYGLLFGISDTARQLDGSFHVFSTTNNLVPLNVWTHVAAVYDQPTGKRLIYVNGAKVAERTDPSITIYSGQNAAAIGARLATTEPANLFVGAIDEVSFYNRALAPSELLSLFNASSAGKCTGAPRITIPPQNQNLPVGATIELAVTATGTQPLAYQWLFKGAAIPGATNATYRQTNAQSTHSGQYTVIVSSSVGDPAIASANVTIGGDCVTAPAGLISWWPGEDNAIDRVGGNAGILRSGAQFGAGLVGRSFSLTGSQHIEIPSSPNLNVTGSFTIEAWVNPAQQLDNQTIFGKWSDGLRSYVLVTTAQNGVRFAISDTANQSNPSFHVFDSPNNVVPLNTWTHVAAVYNQGTGTRQIFINGAKVAERSDPPITISTGTHNAAIGARMANVGAPANFFQGRLDEVSFYGRALTTGEISAVFNASFAGKCTPSIPPSIVTQPETQTVQAGNSATLRVAAAGSVPFSYQWFFNNASLPSETNSTLSLLNVQTTNAGTYRVVVTNPFGSAASSNATLTVTLPPSAIRAGTVTATNGIAVVPISLIANGAENSVSFSVSFATNRLTYESVSLASGAQTGASLIVANTSQADQGRVGFVLAMPGSQTFQVGSNLLLSLSFRAVPVLSTVSTPVSVTDTPIERLVLAADGSTLQATFTSGQVTIPFLGIESDVVPVNNQVSTADWTSIGRMVVGLETAANAGIFLKADAAPRSTLGNGLLTVGDWAQALRYVGGLDPATAAGGPSVDLATSLPLTPATNASARSLRIVNSAANPGLTVQVPIELNSAGGENGVGFSLAFDPEALAISRVTVGSDASSAIIVVNTNQGLAGLVGVALTLPAGQTFAAGVRQVAVAEFVPNRFLLGNTTVEFANRPAIADLSDAFGASLATAFLNGAVNVNPHPTNAPFAPVILGTIDDAGSFISGNLSTDPTVVLTGLSQPGTTVTVTFQGDGASAQTLTDTNGAWTLGWNRQFNPGTNIFSAVASNNVGRVSAPSENFALTIAAAHLTSITRTPSAATQLTLQGPVGLNYTLQVSSNLLTWSDLLTTNLTASPITLTTPTNSVASAGFYRVRVAR